MHSAHTLSKEARAHLSGKTEYKGETHRCAGAVGLQLVVVAGGGFRSSRSPEAVVFKVAR